MPPESDYIPENIGLSGPPPPPEEPPQNPAVGATNDLEGGQSTTAGTSAPGQVPNADQLSSVPSDPGTTATSSEPDRDPPEPAAYSRPDGSSGVAPDPPTSSDLGSGGMSAADGTSRAGVDGTPPPEPSGPLFSQGFWNVSPEELRRTSAVDPPVEHDPYGQAIVSFGGGAAVGGTESLAEGTFDVAKQLTVEGSAQALEGIADEFSEIGDKHPDSGVTGGMSSEPGASIDPADVEPKSSLDNEPNYSVDPGLSGDAAQPPGWFPPMADPNGASAPGTPDAPFDPGMSIDPGASFDPGMSPDATQTGPLGPAPDSTPLDPVMSSPAPGTGAIPMPEIPWAEPDIPMGPSLGIGQPLTPPDPPESPSFNPPPYDPDTGAPPLDPMPPDPPPFQPPNPPPFQP